jgi:hypothetical protein
MCGAPQRVVSMKTYQLKKQFHLGTLILHGQHIVLLLFIVAVAFTALLADVGEPISFADKIPVFFIAVAFALGWERGYWNVLVRKCPKSIRYNEGNAEFRYFLPLYNWTAHDVSVSEEEKNIVIAWKKRRLRVSKRGYNASTF